MHQRCLSLFGIAFGATYDGKCSSDVTMDGGIPDLASTVCTSMPAISESQTPFVTSVCAVNSASSHVLSSVAGTSYADLKHTGPVTVVAQQQVLR